MVAAGGAAGATANDSGPDASGAGTGDIADSGDGKVALSRGNASASFDAVDGEALPGAATAGGRSSPGRVGQRRDGRNCGTGCASGWAI
ncbi:MAG TPA: hypothetical protein VG986_18530 [Pseudolabrys sp.]|nr:hypothetical protein [Pseudolabrys sp.]